MTDSSKIVVSAPMSFSGSTRRMRNWLSGFMFWVVGLPLASWLALRTSLGAGGIWCGFIGGLTVAAGGLSLRFLRQTAIKHPSLHMP